MRKMRKWFKFPTPYETQTAIDVYLQNGDRRLIRKLYRRAFFWGFTHPFATPPRNQTVAFLEARRRRIK